MAKEKRYEFKTPNLILRPEDPNEIWDCKWHVFQKNEPEREIGYATFAGERARGTVPLYAEIYDKYDRNKGLGTELLKVMIEWAFYHKNVFEITATCEHENSGAVMALQKAGFVYRNGTKEIENYSIIKQKTSWMGLYFIIGIIAGFILAVVTSLPWVGMAIGVVVGVLIGASMDAKENKYREKITGEKDK